MENADRKCATIQTQKQSKPSGQTIYILRRNPNDLIRTAKIGEEYICGYNNYMYISIKIYLINLVCRRTDYWADDTLGN
jgi:hypothetical protein